MKADKMPTTIALLTFSWLIAVSAVLTAAYLFIFKFGQLQLLISGLLILLGGLLLACVVRMLGAIGQILFDLNIFLIGDSRETRRALSSGFIGLDQSLNSRLQSLSSQFQNQAGILHNLSQKVEQTNCDLKDINQNIHQIKVFFEQIERHLDLKK